MPFTPMEFVNNLKYMGFGMLGVFMIVAIIALATYAIGAITAKKEKKSDGKSENEN